MVMSAREIITEMLEWEFGEANDDHAFEDSESIAGETSITVGHIRAAHRALEAQEQGR